MFIYIDESGPFGVPLNRKLSISCAGALVVPEATHDALKSAFAALSSSWPKDKGEVKGKLLGENEVAAAVRLFADHRVLFDCVAIDLGLHRVQEVERHRDGQAARITENLTARHHPDLVAEVHEVAGRLHRLTTPGYVQLVILTQVVERVLGTKVTYFAQTAPSEIGNFRWIIDAKGNHRTEYERLWELLVLPLLETRSFRSPAIHLIEADYSAYSRFNTGLDEPPEQLRSLIPDWKPGQPVHMTNIRLIMEEHRAFCDSRDEIGLQMADVMTNAAARALKGNLQKAAWRDFGRVMLQQFNLNEIIGLVRFHPEDRYWKQTPPYHEVLAHLRRTASPLLVI